MTTNIGPLKADLLKQMDKNPPITTLGRVLNFRVHMLLKKKTVILFYVSIILKRQIGNSSSQFSQK